MDTATFDDVLRPAISVKHFCASLTEGIPRETLLRLDACVFRFLVKVLLAQTRPDTRADDDEAMVQTLRTLLMDFECYDRIETAEAAVRHVLKQMGAYGILSKGVVERTLSAPVCAGKLYAESSKRLTQTNRSAANTNELLDWDDKKERAKTDRQRKREEEKKSQLASEYDDFLRKRGIANDQQAVCLHRSDEGKRHGDDIRCENIHVNVGKNVLLEDTSLYILSGKHYGLVGKNGSGKTTLMRMLTEREFENINPYIQILHVEQEVAGSDDSPVKMILDADVERTQLLNREQALLAATEENMNMDELNALYTRLDEIDAHSAEHRARSILRGLSFTEESMSAPTSRLSGGWRMRVALARALFIRPDLLLLDEPTNHLDLHAVLWLESFLCKWKGTLLIVSHSRSFLNNCCDEIIHLDQKKLTYYKGDYDSFERARIEANILQQRKFEANEQQRTHMMAFVDRFRFKASKAAQAQSRLKAIERMEKVGPVVEEARINFSFPDPEASLSPILQIIDVSFRYHPTTELLFRDVNLGVDSSSRIGIVGANGAGKSTFLKVLTGQLRPTEGQVTRNPQARIGLFSQHHVEHLNLHQTPLEFMKSTFPQALEPQIRAQLSRFGLGADTHMRPNYVLSGGQKSRLAFAIAAFYHPDLLVLDEPTNHLDIDTVEALVRTLTEYRGGVIVISHDEHLITSVCEELWMCGQGQLTPFHGDFEAYKRLVQEKDHP